MENRGILKQRAIANPLFAAAVISVLGAAFGFMLHLHAASYGIKENTRPFVVGFGCVGTVIGLTASYCSYIRQRLRCRLPFSHPSDPVGAAPYVHSALAGFFLFGCGSLIFQIMELPFLSGWPSGTALWFFLIGNLFSFGGILLIDALGITQAMIGEMQHSNDLTREMIGLLCIPMANAFVGMCCGVLTFFYFRLRL